MKDSTSHKLMGVLAVLTLIVGVFSAKVIGDKWFKYQSFKTFQAVGRISRPVHGLIDELQMERTLASQYIVLQDPGMVDGLHQQFDRTDKEFAKFANELLLTEIILLSIPETEIETQHEELFMSRRDLLKKETSFLQQYTRYNNLVVNFLSFQKKMFTYSDEPQFNYLIDGLIHTENLKEAISQEQSYVAYHLSHPQIKAGEFPLISQKINSLLFHEEAFRFNNDTSIQDAVKILLNSPEYKALNLIRKEFEKESGDSKGSKARSDSYIAQSGRVLKELQIMNNAIQKRIEVYAKEGKARYRSEVIWTTTLSVVVLALLIGCFIFIQKSTSPPGFDPEAE